VLSEKAGPIEITIQRKLGKAMAQVLGEIKTRATSAESRLRAVSEALEEKLPKFYAVCLSDDREPSATAEAYTAAAVDARDAKLRAIVEGK